MNNILLFDGVCNLCNSTVNFLIKRDRKNTFKFASLQSSAGQALLKQFGLPTEHFHTFVYIKNNRYYLRSSAALRVLSDLGGMWKILYAFLIIPRPIRDLFYNFIAKRRYKWFGKRNECMIATPALKEKFLE